jgi:hypothetical protein
MPDYESSGHVDSLFACPRKYPSIESPSIGTPSGARNAGGLFWSRMCFNTSKETCPGPPFSAAWKHDGSAWVPSRHGVGWTAEIPLVTPVSGGNQFQPATIESRLHGVARGRDQVVGGPISRQHRSDRHNKVVFSTVRTACSNPIAAREGVINRSPGVKPGQEVGGALELGEQRALPRQAAEPERARLSRTSVRSPMVP